MVSEITRRDPRGPVMNDVEVVRALLGGDRERESAAWARVGILARRTVSRFFGPALDPADLVQEVFVRLFRRLPSLRDPSELKALVIGTSLGVARNQARRARLRRLVAFRAPADLPDVAVRGADLEAREAVRRLYSIMEGARAEDRSFFVARYLEKMEVAEVAVVHGLSLATTKRRLSRAMDRIGRRIARDQALAAYLSETGGLP